MAPSEPHTPNGINRYHASSGGTSPVSTSPESSRSGKSAASGTRGSSRASQHLYMLNNAQVQNGRASSARRDSGRENGVLSSLIKVSNEPARKLTRARTEVDLSRRITRELDDEDRSQTWEVRHGWSGQHYSQEIKAFIQKVALPRSFIYTVRARADDDEPNLVLLHLLYP